MIRIVGDICLADAYFDVGFGLGTDIAHGFNPFKHLQRNPSDFWIGNLECVVSDVTTNTGAAAAPFRISEGAFAALAPMDIYAVANNHIMQHGHDAYERTVASVISAGAIAVGSNASKIIRFEHQGKKIALITFSLRGESFSCSPSYWADPTFDELKELINTKEPDEYLIAFIHWGYEYMQYPTKEQRFFAHWLIDLGVNLVVGGHSHTLQGFEDYQDGRIYYSLGNFVFRMPALVTKIGVILNVDFSNPGIFSHSYILIDDAGAPQIVDENIIPEEYRFEYLNGLIQHNEDMETYYIKVQKSISDFRKINRKWIIKNIHRHSFKELFSVISGFVKRRLKK